MKHISKLILNNFQQWKTGLIEFKPGLNILIGNTESGKSTLFRAIGSILTGKMSEDYIRKGTKGCEVEVQFSDGSVFKRSRNKKDNIANANGTIFERVGKEIPFEYFNKLGKTSIEFGNKELSLCSYSQFEPHFFITLSDYDKSKLIGTICGIDIVDKLVDSINKDIRSNNANIKFLENKIKEQTEQKEVKETEFKVLDEKHTRLYSLINNLKDDFKRLENLSKLSENLFLLNNSTKSAETELNCLKLKFNQFNSEKTSQLQKLTDLKTKFCNISTEINQNNLELNKLKSIENIDVSKANLLDDLMFLKQKLTEYKNKTLEINEDLMKTNKHIEFLEIEKRTLLTDYDKCPLCGSLLCND